MKLSEIHESVSMIDPNLIGELQTEYDAAHVTKLMKEIKLGKTLAPIEVAVLTPRLKKELHAQIDKLWDKIQSGPGAQYRPQIEKVMHALKSKRYVTMDGHHRLIASLKMGLNKVPALVDSNASASDILPTEEILSLIRAH
jgi:hypothetical protein